MYTIGQVSRMFDLPVSTIRYYDKMGLLREGWRARRAERWRGAARGAARDRVTEALGLEMRHPGTSWSYVQEVRPPTGSAWTCLRSSAARWTRRCTPSSSARAGDDRLEALVLRGQRQARKRGLHGRRPDSLPEDGRRTSRARRTRTGRRRTLANRTSRKRWEVIPLDFAPTMAHKIRYDLDRGMQGSGRRTTAGRPPPRQPAARPAGIQRGYGIGIAVMHSHVRKACRAGAAGHATGSSSAWRFLMSAPPRSPRKLRPRAYHPTPLNRMTPRAHR